MSEMSMVERVAHAMAQQSNARVAGMFTINALPMNGEENFLELAKAAIEELRVPTEAMLEAGDMKCGDYGCGTHRMEEIFTSMIDQALQE